MKKSKIDISPKPLKKCRPALTPEARENQMISLAVDEAERQIREGTASSAVLVHYLKLGSQVAKLEMEKTRLETELVKAKTKAIDRSESSEGLYSKAIQAFMRYSGNGAAYEEDSDL